MSRSRAERERRLQELVGDVARAEVRQTAEGSGWVYVVKCSLCPKGHYAKSFRNGKYGTRYDTLRHFVQHLGKAHPEVTIPADLLGALESDQRHAERQREADRADFAEWLRTMQSDVV